MSGKVFLNRKRVAWGFWVVAGLGAAHPAFAFETIRVEVQRGVSHSISEGTSLGASEDREDAPVQLSGLTRIDVARTQDGLSINGRPWPSPSVRISSTEAIRTQGKNLLGEVVVSMLPKGLQVVNVVSLEDYLSGVLSKEMRSRFPLEALKAQAVASRTYALQKKLIQLDESAHLGADVLSQVYGGFVGDVDGIRQAVELTRGQILTYGMEPIEAYFHASCGGQTESGLDALARPLPYLRSVDCPCKKLPQSHWSLQLSSGDLSALLGHAARELHIQGRTLSGRARRVGVGSFSVDAVSFRAKVGYQKVKSLSFEVEHASHSGWTLQGRGFGHGAGLCQWGAKVLADQGASYNSILARYYPGTELQKLY